MGWTRKKKRKKKEIAEVTEPFLTLVPKTKNNRTLIPSSSTKTGVQFRHGACGPPAKDDLPLVPFAPDPLRRRVRLDAYEARHEVVRRNCRGHFSLAAKGKI